MTLNKSYLYLGMSNNFSDYYEESSTDEEQGGGPSTSASTTSAGSSSTGVVSASGTSSSSVRPSVAGQSSSAGARGGSSTTSSSGARAAPASSGSLVGTVAPQAVSVTMAQGSLEDSSLQHFLNLFTMKDIDRLENWANIASSLRGTPGFAVPVAPIPNPLISFLRANWGARWEGTLLSPIGEMVIFQLRAYIRGYAQLTGFERGQWMRLYSVWSMQERAAQLRKLAERGGFLEIE